MIFEPYESLTRLKTKECEKKIQKFQNSQYNNQEIQWVMSEKIHGCNFSFLVNEKKEVKCAKRNSTLSEIEEFYNFQEVLNKNIVYVKKIFDICQQKYGKGNLKQIQVYGELYGGKYRHEEVKENEFQKKVQSEVQYSPNNHFSAFDLKIYLADNQQQQFYEIFESQLEIFEKSGIDYVKPMQIGKYEELKQFDVEEFQSEIYKKFDLPQIEENVAEGVVIRPYNRGHSPLIKKKAEKFFEKVRTPLQEKRERSEQEKLKKLVEKYEKIEEEKKQKIQEKLDLKQNREFTQEICSYICENRLKNMLSKVSEKEAFENLQKFYLEFMKDAAQEFCQDCEEQEQWFKSLKGGVKSDVESQMCSQAKKVIQTYRGVSSKKKKKRK